MNTQAIRILFLKDLFLSQRHLFGYFAGGLVCSILACIPNETMANIGFILIITVAIAAGLHLIGALLLAESIDQTRLFVMSLPVSLLDYSIAKIAVVLTTYMIPWCAMLACFTIACFVMPGAKVGSVTVVPVVFCYLLCAFTIQLVIAVVTESFAWTICVVVACNVVLNVFMQKFFSVPGISEAAKSDVLTWPPLVLQLLTVELVVIVGAIALALFFQTRKRDLV